MMGAGLCELARLGPSLRYLSVAKCSSITDSGLRQGTQIHSLHYLIIFELLFSREN
jgi:hypothetical protein